jgi:hypothetical protein
LQTAERITPDATAYGVELDAAIVSWRRSLARSNKSLRTIRIYEQTAEQLPAFLRGGWMPTRLEAVSREHVELYLSSPPRGVHRHGLPAGRGDRPDDERPRPRRRRHGPGSAPVGSRGQAI